MNNPGNMNSSLEPPPRQMPNITNNSQTRMDIPGGNMNMNNQVGNLQMDISNLPPPMPNSNQFDNAPIVNDRESQNFAKFSGNK